MLFGHDKDEHHHFFWGVFFIAIGVSWTARNLGLISEDIWNYWPMVFSIVGLWKLMHGATYHD